jgi:hypothetical protein
MTPILQSAGVLECYAQGSEGNLLQCILDDLTLAVGGEAVFGLLVGSVSILALYIAGNGDAATPTVATILLGAVAVPVLPPQFRGAAYAVLVVGVAFGMFAAAGRWVLRGGGTR